MQSYSDPFSVSWFLHLLAFLTNVLFSDIPAAVHWSVVGVGGKRLAFTKRPRRFQLTAAVALAMCGWETTCYTASYSLNPSISLPKPCTGTVSKVSPIATQTHTHTQHSTYFSSLSATDSLSREIRNWYGHEVIVRMR